MAKHEGTCVQNPNRTCWACREFELDPEPLETLIALAMALQPDTQDIGPLEKAADGCPACMLAAIVQARKKYMIDPELDSSDGFWVRFDYRERIAAMHREKNQRFAAYVGGSF